MTRILSVSYDESLLKTRHGMLTGRGYEVTSALGFENAMKECTDGRKFDLFVLGHSIPAEQKKRLVEEFRATSPGIVVVLKRSGEDLTGIGANFEIDPWNPPAMLDLIDNVLKGRSTKSGTHVSRKMQYPAA
ncbi:MAG TPA: hypothetical protein VFI60_04570 [Candidatus Acidoferrum sp.]|nr:hypothetical protein [Candidatus Acidoferrum sp.]